MTTCARGWQDIIVAPGSHVHKIPGTNNSYEICLGPYCERRKAKEDRRISCGICGWPLAKTQAEGCLDGDCSFRPNGAEADPQWKQAKLNRLSNRRKYRDRRKKG